MESQIVRYATTPIASRLTGLSTETLREWTSRRALIPADVKPRRKGSPAKYTWQTILVLRLAVTLRERFHLELSAHKRLFANLRRGLRTKSFIALWNQSVMLLGGNQWSLVADSGGDIPKVDAIVLHLAPHLQAISEGFSLDGLAPAQVQYDLFPVQSVIASPLKKGRQASARPALPFRGGLV